MSKAREANRDIEVRRVNNIDCHYFILEKHYAKRLPSISYAFGLFIDGEMVGCCTFGQPGGACLSKGLFGGEYIDRIQELNRLFIMESVELHCAASLFVSRSIRQLPNNICIVSFADSSIGHFGTVYKACNFIYTGLSAKRTEWAIKGMEHLHSKSIADKAKIGGGRWERLKEQYGDRLYKRKRPSKHRYVYIKANKSERRRMLKALKYKQQPYPVGSSSRYDVDDSYDNHQIALFACDNNTGG